MHPQSDLRISYDILTLVIDQLASERCYKELNACSQTCRILLHPCRVHLFSTIRIWQNSHQFVALLKENSMIANYIQKFLYCRIVGTMSKDLANTFLLLNNIQTLYFCGGDWKSLPPHAQHAFTHLFTSPSISRLHLDDVRNFPATLLSGCSTLKHLTMTACHVSSSVACDSILSAPPQLLSLDLSTASGSVMKELPKMIQVAGIPILDLSSLRSLTVYVDNSWQGRDFENLLRLTPKLDYIQCSVYNIMIPDSWAQKLYIVLPTLCSLKLKWIADHTPIDLVFPGLIKILGMLTYQPNCINKLFIILKLPIKNELLPDLDWEGVDEVLAGFPRLKKLTIYLCPTYLHGHNWEDLRSVLQAIFDKTKSTKFSS